ncbi:MAG TPA: EAL domain-containing protein [Pyrinomonadaceae bacterium]|nr:EAL domain-containing protein [Pyrinomonadaceae bacterium]
MIAENSLRLPKPLTWLTVALGSGATLYSLLRLSPTQLDLRFLLLGLVALSLGTRIVIKVPRAGNCVALADLFTILALLIFDGEAAVLLAALLTFGTSLRFRRDVPALLFRASSAAIATSLCAWALRASFGPIAALTLNPSPNALLLAVGLVVVIQAVFNSFVAASSAPRETSGDAARTNFPNYFFWTLITYSAVGSCAAAAALLSGRYGFDHFLAAAAIVAAVHFVYCIHARSAHAPSAQTERAGRDLPAPSSVAGTFRSAFDHAAIGMALVSPKGKWLQVNRSLCELLGYSEEELLTTSFQELTHPDDLAPALTNLKKLVKGKVSSCQTETRYLHKQGHAVCVLWSVARITDAETGAVRLIFQVQDITERKRAEERLMHDAFHDPLTGLPNRALFIDHVKLTIARAKRRDSRLFAVLFLDLDRFKIINDSLGHMIGDQLLVGIARRLETCLREGDTVARVGGDEFTILLEDIEDETEAVSIVERIQTELSAPFNLSGHEVFTTVSIGIAPSSTGYDDPEDILRDADTAMYRAKSLGKARHEVFDKAMHAFAVNLLQLETDLRKALDRREFFMLYQPIVALDDFHLCGFEALVRWQHPERGLISPMDFIPVAEDTGQIIAIGEWALFEACRQMRRWQKSFPSESPLFISVNLSSKQFTQPNLIEQVRVILERTRLDPRSLKLEITESAVMENIDTTTEMLRQLRALGVQLSIDDFGTGYSSLSYLHRFPIDTLKIDRSFVTRMVDNSENIEIVRTIVMLAQILGMDVVAEGVETKEQLGLLRKLGCENGQGYYFSRPTSVTEAEKIINDTCARPQVPGQQNARPVPLSDDKVKAFKLVGSGERS